MSPAGPPGPRVYIHELIDITGHNRARYLHHVTANWGPIGRTERGQRCFGVWATVGSTGRWPQVVNLWEYDNWDALGRNFSVEQTGDGLQDPSLADWWAVAAEFRRGGTDRIVVAADWSPSIDELCADDNRVVPAGYAHETIRCRPGAAADVIEALREDGRAAYTESGFGLVGAFATAMADDDEVIVVWSFADWANWAEFESAIDGPAHRWRERLRGLTVGWRRVLMTDAPLSPLRTGRQPQVGDRRPLGDI